MAIEKESFWRDKLILVSTGLALIINIILWFILFGKFGLRTEAVPLHFSVAYGIDYVASARQVYELPAIGLFFLLVDTLLAKVLYPQVKLLAYFLSLAALFTGAVVLAGGIILSIVNG